jgi:hypothetical protein
MNLGEDGNLLGRVLALIVLICAIALVRGAAYGPNCPFCLSCGADSMSAPAPDSPAAPAPEE